MQKNNSVESTERSQSENLHLPDFSFPEFLPIIRRRWHWIALSIVACWIVAGLYHFTAQTIYESNAQVLVMRKDPKLATTGSVRGGDDEASVTEDLLATHMQLVQSKAIVNQALEDGNLLSLQSILDSIGPKSSPMEYVIDNLSISRGGKGQSKTAHVLNIAFRHIEPVDAQHVVRAVVDSYQRFLDDKFQDVNKEAAELIENAQRGLGQELERAESDYALFRERAPLLWKGNEGSNIHRDRFEQIQGELGNLQLQSTEARARLEIVESGLAALKNDPNKIAQLALIDDKNAARLGILAQVDRGDADTAEFQARQPARLETARVEYESLVSLMIKEKTLQQEFGQQHPEVVNTRKQIELMRDFLEQKSQGLKLAQETPLTPDSLMDAYVKLLKHDLASFEKRERELLVMAANEEEAAKALVSYELEGESLRKEVERQQGLYDAVVDRLRDINLAKDYGGFINETIAEASIGEVVWPRLSIVGLLGTIAGLVLSLVLVGTAELRDRSFHSVDDIRRLMNVPVLSHIPKLDLRANRTSQLTENSEIDPSIMAFHWPKSRESEVFRGLRTNLFFSSQGKTIKILQCTSPNQGDGKSTVAANLAVSIAQSGKKVLLVDCDMRRPRLHELFGISAKKGLVNVIAGNEEPWDVLQATEMENLYVLPCGIPPTNPAELLTSARFEEFLDLLRDRFDIVILDCPPVLAVADPCIVAPRCDGVLVAVRVSADSRPQTLRTKQLLNDVQAPLLGVVVNGWDAPHYGRYTDPGEYAYGYGYGISGNGYYSDTDSEQLAPKTPHEPRTAVAPTAPAATKPGIPKTKVRRR